MNGKNGLQVNAATAMVVPTTFAHPAIETILDEFSHYSGSASLALNITELHVPFQALLSVPVTAHVHAGQCRNEWTLQIEAAAKAHLYPRFEGVLTLVPAASCGSQLQLNGAYVPPFGALGRAIDTTFLHGAVQSSLNRFLRDVAHRVAALAHWARLAEGRTA
jgi:hypothetical protein